LIVLTTEWNRQAAARAVPGAYFDGQAWVLAHPTPRAAVVALKLFPHLMHTEPELVELRDSTLLNAKPVDYATQLDFRIGAERVEREMNKRGWSLGQANALPLDSDDRYQVRDLGYAAACLRKHKGFYLGWARGLGKTIGTAALIDELDCTSTLVVAPNTSKASTWAAELEWATPWLEVLVLPNDAKQRVHCLERAQRLHREGTAFVLIVHYEALGVIAGRVERKGKKTKTIGEGWKKLKITWDLIAADEGHRLANSDTIQARAANKIPAKMRLVLSGSIFQNKIEELYGPLHFLFPTRYKSKWRDFNDRFLDFIENGYGKICVGVRSDRLDALRDELGRFTVVRDKETKAIMSTERVQMSAGQQKVYTDLAETLLAELPNGERIKSSDGIALLTRLRQVATGLDLFDANVVRDSSKLDAAVRIIQENWERGDGYVVFGWYKASLHALAQRLAEVGIECGIIDGDVSQKDRGPIITEFQSGRMRVLLGTISTVSESLNLQAGNHVIRVDRSFNPASNLQALDRCDRQGQKRTVYCTDIVAENTVDDLVVMPALANKSAMRAVIFGGQAL
jgi:SNF2 family DNA or RNA helicase